jgi:hypothetical protein
MEGPTGLLQGTPEEMIDDMDLGVDLGILMVLADVLPNPKQLTNLDCLAGLASGLQWCGTPFAP